jgi:polyisoprenoid-binding protein YceI
MKRNLLLALLACTTSLAWAEPYSVDYTKSSISFIGTHAGKSFNGKFKSWESQINFDAANLASSTISTNIDTSTAHTGNAMFDGTLGTPDWFATANFPKATFTSANIVAGKEPGSYIANGTLTIRDKSNPVALPFTLTPAQDGTVTAKGSLAIDRRAYDIGLSSDPEGEWVSKEIRITINLTASPVK